MKSTTEGNWAYATWPVEKGLVSKAHSSFPRLRV